MTRAFKELIHFYSDLIGICRKFQGKFNSALCTIWIYWHSIMDAFFIQCVCFCFCFSSVINRASNDWWHGWWKEKCANLLILKRNTPWMAESHEVLECSCVCVYARGRGKTTDKFAFVSQLLSQFECSWHLIKSKKFYWHEESQHSTNKIEMNHRYKKKHGKHFNFKILPFVLLKCSLLVFIKCGNCEKI